MKISVITVCLNAKDVIEKTLQSVISQSYKNWEIIIKDGVSTDGTLDIIEKYKDYITYFESQKDDSIYDAMNAAISHTSGDYLIFLNAGDTLFDNNVFENAVSKLKNNNTDIAFGWVNYLDGENSPNRIDNYPNWSDKNFFANFCMCHQCIFYKKSLFENAKYDTSFKVYADWDFTAKCVIENKAKISNLGFCVSNYDTRGFSSKKENFKLIRRERAIIQKRYYGKIYPLLAFDSFLVKNFNTLYRPIRRMIIGGTA